MEPKAHQTERHRRQQLEVRTTPDPLCQLLGQRDVIPDHGAKTLDAVAAQHEPELERAKSASQLNSPIPEVHHLLVLRGAEILGSYAEGAEQGLAVADVVGAAVEVDQHPLVRVEHETIRQFQAV